MSTWAYSWGRLFSRSKAPAWPPVTWPWYVEFQFPLPSKKAMQNPELRGNPKLHVQDLRVDLGQGGPLFPLSSASSLLYPSSCCSLSCLVPHPHHHSHIPECSERPMPLHEAVPDI